MARALQDYMKETSAKVFIDINGLGEPVTYTPFSTGVARDMVANIDRNPNVVTDWTDGNGEEVTAHIFIINDSDIGITSASKRDLIEFDNLQHVVVAERNPTTDGMWRLGVKRATGTEKGNHRLNR